MMRPFLYTLSLGGALLSGACGSQSQIPAELAAVPVQVGTLFIQPTSHPVFSAGVLQYRLYATGDIFYSGDLTYFGNSGGTIGEVQVPFYGRLKVDPQALHSQTYATAGTAATADRVTLATTSVDTAQQTALLRALVTNPVGADVPDANGQFEVDTSGLLVKIRSFDIQGTVFSGTPAAITVNLVASTTPGNNQQN